MGKHIDIAPSPVSLIESLRNIGYSLPTAIADIVDNSIAAGAKVIDIRFSWNGGSPWLAVIDDGKGMTKDELINAMRFGSKNPLEERHSQDLGRFGLGMKTASFSQCRCLTVLSKKCESEFCCEWDLDFISKADNGKWNLGLLNSEAVMDQLVLSSLKEEYLSARDSGTVVLWEKIDRLEDLGEISKQEGNFNALVVEARNHLELVFHRFLSPGPGRKKTEIKMNGDYLEAFDPFATHNSATQELTEQSFFLEGKKIIVQPFVLPHHNKTTPEEYKKYGGLGGYLHNQGFYVYRNNRLIIKGTWFRLINKEELNKLLRVRIDIPNSLDHLWKIDIKKSDASPPDIIRNRLKQVIERIEYSGRKVYKQKGKKSSPLSAHPSGSGLPLTIKFPTKLIETTRSSIIFWGQLKMNSGNCSMISSPWLKPISLSNNSLVMLPINPSKLKNQPMIPGTLNHFSIYS